MIEWKEEREKRSRVESDQEMLMFESMVSPEQDAQDGQRLPKRQASRQQFVLKIATGGVCGIFSSTSQTCSPWRS